jgi:hypothetical protein
MATRRLTKLGTTLGTAVAGVGAYRGFEAERAKNPNATVMSYGTKLGTEFGSRLGAAGSALIGEPAAKVGAPTIVLPPIDTTSLTEVENLFEQATYALARAKADKAQNPGLKNSFNIADNPMKTKNFSDVQSAAQWFKTFFPALRTYRNPTTLSGAQEIIAAAQKQIEKSSKPGFFTGGPSLKGGRRRKSYRRKQTRRKTRRN